MADPGEINEKHRVHVESVNKRFASMNTLIADLHERLKKLETPKAPIPPQPASPPSKAPDTDGGTP